MSVSSKVVNSKVASQRHRLRIATSAPNEHSGRCYDHRTFCTNVLRCLAGDFSSADHSQSPLHMHTRPAFSHFGSRNTLDGQQGHNAPQGITQHLQHVKAMQVSLHQIVIGRCLCKAEAAICHNITWKAATHCKRQMLVQDQATALSNSVHSLQQQLRELEVPDEMQQELVPIQDKVRETSLDLKRLVAMSCTTE